MCPLDSRHAERTPGASHTNAQCSRCCYDPSALSLKSDNHSVSDARLLKRGRRLLCVCSVHAPVDAASRRAFARTTACAAARALFRGPAQRSRERGRAESRAEQSSAAQPSPPVLFPCPVLCASLRAPDSSQAALCAFLCSRLCRALPCTNDAPRRRPLPVSPSRPSCRKDRQSLDSALDSIWPPDPRCRASMRNRPRRSNEVPASAHHPSSHRRDRPRHQRQACSRHRPQRGVATRAGFRRACRTPHSPLLCTAATHPLPLLRRRRICARPPTTRRPQHRHDQSRATTSATHR